MAGRALICILVFTNFGVVVSTFRDDIEGNLVNQGAKEDIGVLIWDLMDVIFYGYIYYGFQSFFWLRKICIHFWVQKNIGIFFRKIM